MRERINRLAKGMIDTESARLMVAPAKIQEVVFSGETAKKEIFVTGENNSNVKGLIYSSCYQVKALQSSFGGLRNHISYEVDAGNLKPGEELKGAFYLVTNRGEQEIPYSFAVALKGSGQVLESLKTVKDFAAIAREDMASALQLFDYQDFVEAPFMKDSFVRSVYDGLRGHKGRGNLLEEFLVAAGGKTPVTLQMESDERSYGYAQVPTDDVICISRDGWGYVCLEVSADGDFIETIKPAMTDRDFHQNQCQIDYRINPKKLHRGRNYGSITVSSPQKTITVSIMAEGPGNTGTFSGEEKGRLQRYLSLRLDYETGLFEEALLKNKMFHEAELLKAEQGGVFPALLLAELNLLDHKKEAALSLLEECRSWILENRLEEQELYCFYQYFMVLAEEKKGQKEALLRLVRKYMEEGGRRPYLLLLLCRLDDSLRDSPGMVLHQMRQLFMEGSSSPFLYVEACKLWIEEPGLLRIMDSFELHALNLGAKKGMITLELAEQIGRMALSAKTYHRIYRELLERLYEQYPSILLLEAVCCLLIRGDCRGETDFVWYERGVEAGISLTRLYEYYLYSLPADYGHALPKEVLLYFSYDNDLDIYSKSVLYGNILRFIPQESELYQSYERDMEKFAMSQLFDGRIDSLMAVIYHHMIYEDMIDQPVAKVLPAVLCAYKIQCKNPRMQYVSVRCQELTEERTYAIYDGVAYVPLFSENSILIFQDGYGNRYFNVRYLKTRVLDRPELEKRCCQVYPEHPMLRLRQCNRILKEGISTEEQASCLEEALAEIPFHKLYQKKIMSAMVEFYRSRETLQPEEGSDGENGCFLSMDYDQLSSEERKTVCETLIGQNHMKEAYEMIGTYGIREVKISRLLRLCTKMILQKLFDQDDLLLHLSYEVFRAGKSDSVILDYLCEHFNGTSEQMFEILYQAVQEHVETYDLEERLLAQMLFSVETGKMDQVFELYASRKRTNESIVKAYFTVKCVEYFIDGKPAGQSMFAYLEQALYGIVLKGKAPTIYLLALTKYYSQLAGLKKEQQELCRNMTDILLEEGLRFPYMKKLSDYAAIPRQILDRAMVQYCTDKNAVIDFKLRIVPGEEEFHSEEMKRVYLGIFVKEKLLFEGETMEYQIFEKQGETMVLKEEGQAVCEQSMPRSGETRFGCLNQMGLCLKNKDEAGLREQMEEYLLKNALAEEIFDLL